MQHEELSQIHGHLYNLVNQVEQMQWELARLSREAQQNNSRMTALTRHVMYAEAQKHLHERLAEFTTQLEESQEKIEDLAVPQKRIEDKMGMFLEQLHLAQAEIQRIAEPQERSHDMFEAFADQLEGSDEKLEELNKTVKKLSRTQFKANTLSESREQQLNDSLALLRDLATKREELNAFQQKEEQQKINNIKAQARRELAAEFLPVLDGIDMALEHALPVSHDEEKEEESSDESNVPTPSQTGFFRKLFKSPPPDSGAEVHHESHHDHRELQDLRETAASWLRGLEIVRDRFLRLLEGEGIQRIPDVNTRFDPHRHVAIDTKERDDVADSTVISVIRKGYMQEERVLRYAEVIVAKNPNGLDKTISEDDDELVEDIEEFPIQT